MEVLYLYAVTDCLENPGLGAIGVGVPPADVEVVSMHGLGIALSRMGDPSFAPTVLDVQAHQGVLDRLLEHCTVLPFSFSTIARDLDAVRQFVGEADADFRRKLAHLAGHMEVGVKVLWRKEAMRAELEREGHIRPELGQGNPERYKEAIRVGQLVEQRIGQWRSRYVPQIVSSLSRLGVDMRESRTITATMLWNGSFLVARAQEPAFRGAVSDLDARLGDRLDFRYAANLPPYSFIDLRYPREA